MAVSSCQSVLIVLWEMLPGDIPKLLEGLLTWQTLGTLPTLCYHTVTHWQTALLQELGKLPRSFPGSQGLIFSTKAPEVQAVRTAFLRDRRARLGRGTLGQGHVWPERIKASLRIICALMYLEIPVVTVWFLLPGAAQILC